MNKIVNLNKREIRRRFNKEGELAKSVVDPTKAELVVLAKLKGIKNTCYISKYDLAEKLGIELKMKSCKRKKRTVEITNSDGTITTYSSINKAALALNVCPTHIYTLAVNNMIKIN